MFDYLQSVRVSCLKPSTLALSQTKRHDMKQFVLLKCFQCHIIFYGSFTACYAWLCLPVEVRETWNAEKHQTRWWLRAQTYFCWVICFESFILSGIHYEIAKLPRGWRGLKGLLTKNFSSMGLLYWSKAPFGRNSLVALVTCTTWHNSLRSLRRHSCITESKEGNKRTSDGKEVIK